MGSNITTINVHSRVSKSQESAVQCNSYDLETSLELGIVGGGGMHRNCHQTSSECSQSQ